MAPEAGDEDSQRSSQSAALESSRRDSLSGGIKTEKEGRTLCSQMVRESIGPHPFVSRTFFKKILVFVSFFIELVSKLFSFFLHNLQTNFEME